MRFAICSFAMVVLIAGTHPIPAAEPFIDHTIRDVEGWKVRVDNALLSGPHKETGDVALRLLSNEQTLRIKARVAGR